MLFSGVRGVPGELGAKEVRRELESFDEMDGGKRGEVHGSDCPSVKEIVGTLWADEEILAVSGVATL